MRRLYIGVFGSGLGHATRMLAVAKVVEDAGFAVRFSSSGETSGFLRRGGKECNDIPLVDVIYTENGSFSAKETMKFTPVIFARFLRQVCVEVRNLLRFGGEEAVLSDSVLATVIAARLVGRRTITVANQLRLESSPRTPAIARKLLSTGSITVGNKFWELSDEILIPDLPPPYTISERNLWNAGSAVRRARYIGFIVPPLDPTEDALVRRLKAEGGARRKVLWQISGPPQTRAALLPRVLSIVGGMGSDTVSIVSAGNPAGMAQPVEVPGGYMYGWCPVKDALVGLSDVVVSRAGHSSIAQFILQGKPSVLVPIPSHSEQEGNALKAERLGVSVKVEEPDLRGDVFERALSETAREPFLRRVREMREYALRYDAVGTIVKEVYGHR